MGDDRVPVCITGMGRSGTSLCAQLLHRSGLYLGSEADLLPADEANTDGYWENADLVRLNEAVLHVLGGAWDSPPMLTAEWTTDERLIPLKARAQELLPKFSGREPWGWKDPRSSLTLPFWLDLIPDLKVVVCLRNPLEVVLSLSKRHYFSYALGMRLWYQYNRAILDTVSADRRIVTHYDRYFTKPRPELRRVLAVLDMHVSTQKIARACSVVATDLRHTRYTAASLVAAGVASEIVDLYACLCAEAGMVDPPQRDQDLSENRENVPTIAWFMGTRDVRERDESRRYTESLEFERTALKMYTEELDQDRTAVRAYLAEIEQERTALHRYIQQGEDERTALRAYTGELEDERTALREYLAELEQARIAIHTHLDTVVQERDALRAYMEDIERDRVGVRDYLERVIEERDALRDYMRDLERERDGLRVYLSDIERERAILQEHLAEYQRGNEALIQTVTDQQSAFEQLTEEGSRKIAALATTIADKEAQMDLLRQEIAGLHATIATTNNLLPMRIFRRLRALAGSDEMV